MPANKKKINSKNKKSQGLIMPLYFGWQVRIVLERVKDMRQHIIGPFKKYWQYMTAIIILIIAVSTAIFVNQYQSGQAATYTWTQTDWSGGASTTTTAVHPTNQTNWDKFYSSSGTDTSGGELKMIRE